MRYMMMIMADKDFEAGLPPNAKLVAEIGKLTEEMTRAGVVLATGGLAPSSAGMRIRASEGTLRVIDGPFSEIKELIGGFAIVEARSREEALEWGMRFMKIHQDILGPTWEGLSEIRPVFGMDDLAPRTR